jgi:hypothetical protein
MMCGCGIEPDGLWDPADFEIQAVIRHEGKVYQNVEMSYAGRTSKFEADTALEQAGLYEISMYAFDPANGNAGLDHATVIVQPE